MVRAGRKASGQGLRKEAGVASWAGVQTTGENSRGREVRCQEERR